MEINIAYRRSWEFSPVQLSTRETQVQQTYNKSPALLYARLFTPENPHCFNWGVCMHGKDADLTKPRQSLMSKVRIKVLTQRPSCLSLRHRSSFSAHTRAGGETLAFELLSLRAVQSQEEGKSLREGERQSGGVQKKKGKERRTLQGELDFHIIYPARLAGKRTLWEAPAPRCTHIPCACCPSSLSSPRVRTWDGKSFCSRCSRALVCDGKLICLYYFLWSVYRLPFAMRVEAWRHLSKPAVDHVVWFY